MKDYSNSKVPALFEVLEHKGISGTQLAAGIGVSTGNIFDWKSGRSAPKPEALRKIADYLNCSTDYLLGRTPVPDVTLSEKEQQLLEAYKAHPELHLAIDKLLGIEETETIRIAARSNSDEPIKTIKVPKSKIKAALEDDSIKSDDDL